MYTQKGKLKKKKKIKKVEEENINPYDKIGTMMAKKMKVPMTHKKKNSRTNTVTTKRFKVSESLDSYLSDKNSIQKNVKSAKLVNEIFGLSKKEKEKKQLKLDIDKLKEEISKYNWLRMTAQPGRNAWSDNDLFTLVNYRINNGKNELPYLYKLLPELFELKKGSTNAVRCLFRLSNQQTGIPYGESYEGIVPAKFSFIVDPYTRTVENVEETNQRAAEYIMSKINQKYNI